MKKNIKVEGKIQRFSSLMELEKRAGQKFLQLKIFHASSNKRGEKAFTLL